MDVQAASQEYPRLPPHQQHLKGHQGQPHQAWAALLALLLVLAMWALLLALLLDLLLLLQMMMTSCRCLHLCMSCTALCLPEGALCLRALQA